MDKQKNDLISKPSQLDGNHHTERRRRGEILEQAILEATWDELSEVGYKRLTIDRIASRAKTNKTTIYRRWANKSNLVLAAAHNHVLSPNKSIPNTGNLSDDVLILLRTLAQPLQIIGAETLHGLMVEHLSKDVISSIHPGTEDKFIVDMTKILKNAELRGEVNLEKISRRIISLPADLLRYEVLTTYESVYDKTLKEFVDDIFLPLVTQIGRAHV